MGKKTRDWIHEQLESGYSPEEVKEALIDEGYKPDKPEKLINEIKEDGKDRKSLFSGLTRNRTLFLIGIAILSISIVGFVFLNFPNTSPDKIAKNFLESSLNKKYMPEKIKLQAMDSCFGDVGYRWSSMGKNFSVGVTLVPEKKVEQILLTVKTENFIGTKEKAVNLLGDIFKFQLGDKVNCSVMNGSSENLTGWFRCDRKWQGGRSLRLDSVSSENKTHTILIYGKSP